MLYTAKKLSILDKWKHMNSYILFLSVRPLNGNMKGMLNLSTSLTPPIFFGSVWIHVVSPCPNGGFKWYWFFEIDCCIGARCAWVFTIKEKGQNYNMILISSFYLLHEWKTEQVNPSLVHIIIFTRNPIWHKQ